jgi:hypothetical protein
MDVSASTPTVGIGPSNGVATDPDVTGPVETIDGGVDPELGEPLAADV